MVLDEIDLHVEMLRHGDDALRRPGDRFLRCRFDAFHRLVGVQGGDTAAPAFVHGYGGDGGDQGFGKVAQRLVAGEQCHGDAVVSGGVGVDEKFTAQRAVEENMVVSTVHGVAQGIAGAACPGVVAGEEHGVKFLLIQTAHHAQGVARPAAVHADAPGKSGRVDVPGGVVGVLHQNLRRTGGKRALTGGGDLTGHLLLGGAVVKGGGALRLRPRDDAAGAFHIGA